MRWTEAFVWWVAFIVMHTLNMRTLKSFEDLHSIRAHILCLSGKRDKRLRRSLPNKNKRSLMQLWNFVWYVCLHEKKTLSMNIFVGHERKVKRLCVLNLKPKWLNNFTWWRWRANQDHFPLHTAPNFAECWDAAPKAKPCWAKQKGRTKCS